MKRTASDFWPSLAINGLLLLAALAALFPLYWMLAVSLMPTGAASSLPPPLWPKDPTLEHYRQLLAQGGIGRLHYPVTQSGLKRGVLWQSQPALISGFNT